MALDSQAREVVDRIAAVGSPPISDLSPFNARNLPTPVDAAREVASLRGGDVGPESIGGMDHILISGRGGDILARVYRPVETEEERPPVLVYYHGGGWVLRDLNVYDASCRGLANTAGCIVVSVAYRKAPEHRFPAATDDAYDAYRWVRKNAAEVGGDLERVAVAGESAGGNLAAVTCLRARDEGAATPEYQVLVYPITNYAFDTPSYEENADAVPLDREKMRWFWGHYLSSGEDGAHPHASPLRAESHGGLPPALVITAEEDPLTSEAEAYTVKLRDTGVPVTQAHYDGVMHGFFGMPFALDKAREAINLAADELRSAFRGAEREPPAVGGDATAVGSPLREGLQVVGSDEESVGRIKEVRSGDFLVDRSALQLHRDVYVPAEAVRSIADDRVTIDVPADGIDDTDWERGPLL